jgi:uncharacterized protein (TIGR02145 family)
MLCGCSENGNEEGHNEPMSFSAAINGRTQTRTTVDTARTSGDNLIVCAAEPANVTTESTGKITRTSTTPDGSWPSGANVAVQQVGGRTMPYTVNSNNTITSPSPLYWKNSNDISVISWYPYSTSMPSSWSVNSDQSTSDASSYNSSDFLYAPGTFTYGGGSNNKLTYSHETAKVVINIVKANDVTSASSVSAVTIGTASSQIDLSGTVNGSAITATTATIGYIKPYQTTPVDATNYVATYSALVIPQTIASGKQFISVTLGSNTYYYVLPGSLTLQGGHEYDYNVTIPPSANSPLTPGQYYLLDNGAVSTLPIPSGRTAIAVVFSNRIGPEEQVKGYHNYAMALKDITGTSWGPYGGTTSLTDHQTLTAYYNDLSSGYLGTFTYGMASNTYPAFLQAKNYSYTVAAPTTIANSGWYLPSIGQWWDVIANLGKVDMSSYQSSIQSTANIGNSSTISNINSSFTAAGGSVLTTSYYYWSASEFNSDWACVVYFQQSYVDPVYTDKDNATHYVRAVIAF